MVAHMLLMLCIGLVIANSTIKDGINFKIDREVYLQQL